MNVFSRRTERYRLDRMLKAPAEEITKNEFYKDYYDVESYVKIVRDNLCGVFTPGHEPLAFREGSSYYRIHTYEKVEVKFM